MRLGCTQALQPTERHTFCFVQLHGGRMKTYGLIALLLSVIFGSLSQASTFELHEACNRAFSSESDRGLCLGSAKTPGQVSACAKAFAQMGGALRCLRAKSIKPSVIRACGKASKNIHEILSCIDLARGTQHLKACASSFVFLSDKEKCFQSPAEPELIKACSRSFALSADKFTCIRLNPNAKDVENCRNWNDSESLRKSCIGAHVRHK